MRSIIIVLLCTLVCASCGAAEPKPPARLVALVEASAKKYKLDPIAVKAIIEIESRWKPDAKSAVGAVGLMQVTEKSWDWICRDVLGQLKPWVFADATDPEKNITVGCSYLAWLQEHWRTRLDHVTCGLDTAVIASYNCGQGRVLEAKGKVAVLPKETQTYLKRFAAAKEKFRLQELEGE